MAFRWFRQNKNFTRWLYIGVTVFVMVTFTVTGAMLQGLSSEQDADLAGSFTTPAGRRVEVGADQFRRLSFQLGRMTDSRRISEETVWTLLMLEALADDEGIALGDEQFADFLRISLAFIRSDAEYKQYLKVVGMTAAEFEGVMRRRARAGIYGQLVDELPRVRAAEVVTKYQEEHELFEVEFVAFTEEAERAQLAGQIPDAESLRAFYEDELDSVTKGNEFSEPPRYGLEAALLEVEGADAAALRERLPEEQREVSEEEIEGFYNRNIHRYDLPVAPQEAKEPENPENPENPQEPENPENPQEPEQGGAVAGAAGGEDQAEGDEHAGHDHGDAAEEAAAGEHGHRPLAEVRDAIVTEILVERIVLKAAADYNVAYAEKLRKEAEAQSQPAAEDGAAADDSAPGAGRQEEPENLLKTIAATYGLEWIDYGEPVEAAGLRALERIGSEELERQAVYLSKDRVTPLAPSAERRMGLLVKMRERVDPKPKPYEEVADKVPEAWLTQTARTRAEANAKSLREAVQAAARQAVAADVEKIEQEARAVAEQRIAADAVTDAAEQQKIIDQELADRKEQIDGLIRPHEGEAFASLAAERGLAVTRIPEFRKSTMKTRFYQDEEPTPTRFVKGHQALFQLAAGSVLGPVRDTVSGAHVVARVIARRPPEVADMRLRDREEAERRVRSEKDPSAEMRQYFPGRYPHPELEFESLKQRLGLEVRVAPEREEAETPPAEPGTSP